MAQRRRQTRLPTDRNFEFIASRIFHSAIGGSIASLGRCPFRRFTWAAASFGEEEGHLVVLVGRKLSFAHVAPSKGGDIGRVSEAIIKYLRKFQVHGDIVFRTGQESMLSKVVRKVCQLRRSSRSCFDHSCFRHSQGNGFVEQAVQSFEGMMRAHKTPHTSQRSVLCLWLLR